MKITIRREGCQISRVLVQATRRWATTSAGISAGIDAALYIVSRLHGQELARETAGYMEYDWRAVTPDFVVVAG